MKMSILNLLNKIVTFLEGLLPKEVILNERNKIAKEVKVSRLYKSDPALASLKIQQIHLVGDPISSFAVGHLLPLIIEKSNSIYMLEWKGDKVPTRAILPDGFVYITPTSVLDENHKSIGSTFLLEGDTDNSDCLILFMK